MTLLCYEHNNGLNTDKELSCKHANVEILFTCLRRVLIISVSKMILISFEPIA